jgi:hypothetical protein
MPEIMRQRTRIVAIVREFVSCRVAKHVRVNSEGEFGGFACSLNHPQEPSWCHGYARLRNEDIRALALQRSQGAEFGPVQRMHALNPTLSPVHMQPPMPQVDLRPAQLTELLSSEAVSIRPTRECSAAREHRDAGVRVFRLSDPPLTFPPNLSEVERTMRP